MKLNCDLGESFGAWTKGADEAIMPLIDYANIACGFHAGDPVTMSQTVSLALKHQVTIGAHPSYPDLVGFGRRSMALSEKELIATMLYQVGALQGIAQSQGGKVSFIKPHGALYNDMMKSADLFTQVCKAVSMLPQTLPLVIQALPDKQQHQNIANSHGVTLWFEAFADRNYQDNGLLVSRQQHNAVISDPELVCDRIREYLVTGNFPSEHGKPLKLQIDTLCVHGDNPSALALVAQIRNTLAAN